MSEEYGFWPGRYPAIVRIYQAEARQVRVEIPGVTDGADVLPLAEIEYPIGDKSRAGSNSTEIEILEGDTVWVAFLGGDPRFPIITGYRNPQAGNSTGWRRSHHANMELLADQLMNLIAQGDVLIKSGTHVTVQAPSATVQAAESTITGNLTVQGKITGAGGMQVSGGAGVSVEGNFSAKGNIDVDGNISATGTIIDAGGNSNHHSH